MTQERKRKPNIIDFVILLAVLAVLAAIGYRVILYPGERDTVRIRYVLEVEQIQTEFCSKVTAEDLVYPFQGTDTIGIVTATSTAPAHFKGADKEGNPVYTEMEGYNMLYITVEADAVQSDAGFEINGQIIRAGEVRAVQFPQLYCEAECIRVDVLE